MTSEPSESVVAKSKVPDLVFYGFAGAGKTTCADYLQDSHGANKISFATALKEIAVKLWGQEAFTDRDKLQKLGTLLRELDEDVWARLVFNQIDDNIADAGISTVTLQSWVNDDCRFPNEYWGLKERGFIFVRVLSSEEIRVDRLLRNGKLQDITQLEHSSETALVGFEATKNGIVDDYTIFNNSSLDDLYTNIENVLTDIEERA